MTGGLVVVGAHPDDECLVAGGVLAACSEAGIPAAVVCLTRGERGPDHREPGFAEPLADARVTELQAACAELGVDDVLCLDFRDAYLPWEDAGELQRALADALDERAPQAVISFGEDGLYWHPDHVAVSALTRLVVAARGGETRLYEAVWHTTEVLALVAAAQERGLPTSLWDIDPAAFGVDPSDETITLDVRAHAARKLRALRRHVSQVDPDHLLHALPDDLAETYLGAEHFRCVLPADTRDDWLLRALEPVNG